MKKFTVTSIDFISPADFSYIIDYLVDRDSKETFFGKRQLEDARLCINQRIDNESRLPKPDLNYMIHQEKMLQQLGNLTDLMVKEELDYIFWEL